MEIWNRNKRGKPPSVVPPKFAADAQAARFAAGA